MTRFARIVAGVAGVAGLLLAGAALVYEATLAVDDGLVWSSSWWNELTAERSLPAIIGAVVATLVTILLLILAARHIAPRRAPDAVEYAVEDGTARLSLPALRKALRRRFEGMVPGSRVTGIDATRSDDGWSVRLAADLPICDLQDMHSAVFEAFRDDLRCTASLELVHLDIVADSMRAAARPARRT